MDTSLARPSWKGSVPTRWVAWTSSVPMIHSWPIGSSLTSVTVMGTPTGSWTRLGWKCEKRNEIVTGRDAGRRALTAGIHGEVVGEVGGAAIDADLGEPARRRHPFHPLVAAKVVEEQSGRGGAVGEAEAGGRIRQKGGLVVGEQE